MERNNRVAFIGISNWALDPAKMNRGIMVNRSDPEAEELAETARDICTGTNTAVELPLSSYFNPLAIAYIQVCKKDPFFGLRDFYR